MIRVCQTSADVCAAWELLYRLYLQAGHIAPHPGQIHAAREASADCCVLRDDVAGVPAGTLSVFLDNGQLLPFRRAYPDLVLRQIQSHHKVAEIGMLGSTHGNLVDLLTWSFWFCVHERATHILCCVPPNRTRLYHLAMGFEVCGPRSVTLHNAPVIPMLADLAAARQNRSKLRFIDYFERCPVPKESFSGRYNFADWKVPA